MTTLDRFRLDAAELAAELEAPLVYLVPTRGRPGNIVELLAAWTQTAYPSELAPAAELVIIVDDDDPALDGYVDVVGPSGDALPEYASLLVGPRLRLGGTLNEVAPLFATDGRIGVGFMGDDHRPRSSAWDERVANAHRRRPFAVVYGNDLVRGAQLPTAVSIDARIIDALGYYVPPGMVHLYLDDYWLRLGRELGTLTYLDDVVIEHLHPTAGTAKLDAGYVEVNDPELYAADEARFRTYLAELHPAAMQALEPVMLAELRRLEQLVTQPGQGGPS